MVTPSANPALETDVKEMVKERYGKIAEESLKDNKSSCCAESSSCCDSVENSFSTDYSKLKGYNPDADLKLGCGVPTEFAQIKEGDTVIDLGSGAGNDVFVARALTGERGKVIGIDFTEKMIEKARLNNEKLGFSNVEFRFGDIEDLPVIENFTDVVISNCVLNLVPDKKKAFSEIFRVLKPGGHFSVSDIVVTGELPEKIKSAAEMYTGCVGGAIKKEEYLDIIKDSGFVNMKIQKENAFTLSDDVLEKYMTGDKLKEFRASGTKLLSISVYAEKPTEEQNTKKCC